MKIPRMIRLKQHFDSRAVADPGERVRQQIQSLGLGDKVLPGQRVALACSSRGIVNYATVVEAVVDALKTMELKPFIVPAMGSHGSASAEGQKEVLADYGITEARMAVPVRSSLDVMEIGSIDEGVPVYIDALAWQADHIVLINRVAAHTDYSGEFESGLMKLMAIGLGKQAGAEVYHNAMFSFGCAPIIGSIGRKVLETGKILFGVGLVENGNRQTAEIGVLAAEEIEAGDKRLLALAKKLKPALPFEEADILHIQQMGKDISGTGFDTKTVGRIGLPLYGPEPEKPRIKRVIVSDLTEGSHGNAVGVGNADIITDRLLDKIDRHATTINTITGASPEMGRIPMALANDREALEIAAQCVGLTPPESLKIIMIKNTAWLVEVEVSEVYQEEISGRDDLAIVKPAREIAFLENGYLPSFDSI